MKSTTKKCCFCREAGAIKYYYLGLHSKIKLWTQDQDMCSRITANPAEKELWINGNDACDIQKEVWNGARFAELAWFWDLDKNLCIREGCRNVLSADDVLQPLLGLMEVEKCIVGIAVPNVFMDLSL